tara:strand:- start:3121 stop:3915 length:795 start_codon:yes stop_codon:yes gene_type:complete
MKINNLKTMIKEALSSNSVLLAKPTPLSEANYANVKRKIEDEQVPFVMISAFRGGVSKRENIVRQRNLEEYVASARFPWTKMPGSGYVEDAEEEYEIDSKELTEDLGTVEDEDIEVTEEEPEGIEVKENSILIWEQTRPDKGERGEVSLNLFELAKFLAKKYDQDSFIHGQPVCEKRPGGECFMRAQLYAKSGDPIKAPWAGPWSSLEEIGEDDVYWSKIGSKKAKLVELLDKYRQLPVKSKMDAMKKQYYLNAVKDALKHMEE